jgi:hypothetical protein
VDSPLLSRQEVLSLVRVATGLRTSPCLSACADLVWLMAVRPDFKRGEAKAMLAARGFGPRCVDRALLELENAKLIEVSQDHAKGRGGGHLFRLIPQAYSSAGQKAASQAA